MASIFLKLSTGPSDHPLIRGESLDIDHRDEIEIDGWSWTGFTNNATYDQFEKDPKVARSNTKVTEITVNKKCDRASVTLARYCALGMPINTAVIYCRKKTGYDLILDYLVITMTNVTIFGFNLSSSGQEHDHNLTESVALHFEEIKLEYVMQKDSGMGMGTVPFGWNQPDHVATC